MRKFILIATIFLQATVLLQAQQVQHVVLITVDGFRPDFYLDSSWHAGYKNSF
jgi:predicted AlkP superfamily pyrophosphatase or phosphodiesterase